MSKKASVTIRCSDKSPTKDPIRMLMVSLAFEWTGDISTLAAVERIIEANHTRFPQTYGNPSLWTQITGTCRNTCVEVRFCVNKSTTVWQSTKQGSEWTHPRNVADLVDDEVFAAAAAKDKASAASAAEVKPPVPVSEAGAAVPQKSAASGAGTDVPKVEPASDDARDDDATDAAAEVRENFNAIQINLKRISKSRTEVLRKKLNLLKPDVYGLQSEDDYLCAWQRVQMPSMFES